MLSQLSLCPRRSIAFDPPRIGPSLAAAALALALTGAFGWMATVAMSGRLPRLPLGAGESTAGLTILAGSLGFVGGIAGLLATLAALGNAWHALKFRTGLLPVLESEGECTILQEENGLWGLELAFTSPYPVPPAPRVLTTRAGFVSAQRMLFRLPEAEAATAVRMFRPGQTLQVRWCDAPFARGGSILLEIRSREEAALSEPLPASASTPGTAADPGDIDGRKAA